jgi:hypothetical protein
MSSEIIDVKRTSVYVSDVLSWSNDWTNRPRDNLFFIPVGFEKGWFLRAHNSLL